MDLRNTDVLLDYYHMTREHEDPKILLTLGKENLRHIHFACPFLPGEGERVFPLYENEWRGYAEFASILKEIGYNGRISWRLEPATLIAMPQYPCKSCIRCLTEGDCDEK